MMERAMWSSGTTTRPKATTVFKVDGRIRRFAQCCRRTVFVRARFSFRPSFRMASSSANPHTMQGRRRGFGGWRSEEHTSELQSLMRISYAVFCLKKKKRKTRINKINSNNNVDTHSSSQNKQQKQNSVDCNTTSNTIVILITTEH